MFARNVEWALFCNLMIRTMRIWLWISRTFKLKFANVKIVHLFVKQTLLRKLRFSRGRGGPKGKITSENGISLASYHRIIIYLCYTRDHAHKSTSSHLRCNLLPLWFTYNKTVISSLNSFKIKSTILMAFKDRWLYKLATDICHNMAIKWW